MEFILKIPDKSIHDIMRQIGYQPASFQSHLGHDSEFSIVRKIVTNDYPRFHLYIILLNGGEIGHKFNLHLDQKKPSYEGSHAHSGEYHGELVEREAERIKNLISSW